MSLVLGSGQATLENHMQAKCSEIVDLSVIYASPGAAWRWDTQGAAI